NRVCQCKHEAVYMQRNIQGIDPDHFYELEVVRVTTKDALRQFFGGEERYFELALVRVDEHFYSAFIDRRAPGSWFVCRWRVEVSGPHTLLRLPVPEPIRSLVLMTACLGMGPGMEGPAQIFWEDAQRETSDHCQRA